MTSRKTASNTFISCRNGVAAVEFALIAPILIAVLIGVVDFSMYVHQRMTLDILSRDAVQYVVQGGNVVDIGVNIIETSDAYNRAQAEGRVFNYTAVQECQCSGGAPVDCGDTCPVGEYVKGFCAATITSTFTPIVPYPGVETDGITLTGYTRMQFNW